MTWVRYGPEPAPHRCSVPSEKEVLGVFVSPKPKTGAVWECDCGKRWELTIHSDQREGAWITWAPVKEDA